MKKPKHFDEWPPERQEAWIKHDKEKRREHSLRHYAKHPDRVKKRRDEWRKNNPEKVREWQRAWRKKNEPRLKKYQREYYL